ncbi:helix-turn-helix domain-containing protein [Vagococcus sp.]|uniref:helix-turn-helix domain-containing protein n=1 Tax=Vagococcus sp. TaxID=1933889 RepID=UPI002FC6B87F
MEFGKRLKNARNDVSKTQEMVAKDLHVSRQTISSWENERSYPDISSLIQISDYYNLSLDTLLKEDVGMKEEFKKTEELAKINRIWRVSYLINLILVVAVLLGSLLEFSTFKMNLGTQIVFLVVMLLNMGLLMYVTVEKDKLKDKPRKVRWRLSKRRKQVIFSLEVGFVVLSIMLKMLTNNQQVDHLLGIFVGILCATSLIFIVENKTLPSDKDVR